LSVVQLPNIQAEHAAILCSTFGTGRDEYGYGSGQDMACWRDRSRIKVVEVHEETKRLHKVLVVARAGKG